MASVWLDRLAPGASPASRRGSPAPRQLSYAPSRPGLDSRSTTLSVLVRSDSSSSTLAVAGKSGASGLRPEVTRAADVRDPLAVLGDILRSTVADAEEEDADDTRFDPELVEADIEFDGLGLNEYLEASVAQQAPAQITVRSIQTAEEYERERGKFEDLHKTIAKCDQVLRSVETSLAAFQKDLGAVSSEIESLQERSAGLTTKLENRKVVERMLGPAVEEVSISPAIVKTIAEGPINEDWVKALADFEKRGKAIDSKLQEESPIKAAQEVQPILDNLRKKANERIRDHIVAQIKAMRSPNINAQVIQQNHLIKYKDLFAFLSKHQKKLSEDIVHAYVNTMRWYYQDHFTRYRTALEKLKVVQIGREDTIGTDPSLARGPRHGAGGTAFDLGRRGAILSSSNTAAITSYLAEEDKGAHHIEVPFRNFSLALVDNVSSEYAFFSTFFSSLPHAQISRKIAEMFQPTYSLSRDILQGLLEVGTLDCLGILLCIRLSQHFAMELQRRRIPVMDDHINGTNIALWPNFQKAMDAHTESVKMLANTVSARSAASKLSFTGSSADASKASMAPHFLTQRFGQFLYGILAISKESGDDEPVASSLSRLRTEYESFITKAAKSVGGADARKRERFLANNFVLVETIVSDTQGKLAQDQKVWLEEMRAKSRAAR